MPKPKFPLVVAVKLDHDKSINQTILDNHPGLDLSQYKIKVDNNNITLTWIKPKPDYTSLVSSIIKNHISKFELDSELLVEIFEKQYDEIEYEYHHTSTFVDSILADIAKNKDLDDFGLTLYAGVTDNNEIILNAYFDGQLEDMDDHSIDMIKISNIMVTTPSVGNTKLVEGKIELSTSPVFSGEVTILV